MADQHSFHVNRRELPGKTVLSVSGTIDEHADLVRGPSSEESPGNQNHDPQSYEPNHSYARGPGKRDQYLGGQELGEVYISQERHASASYIPVTCLKKSKLRLSSVFSNGIRRVVRSEAPLTDSGGLSSICT